MVTPRRQVVVVTQRAVEDRRHGAVGQVVLARRVAEPRAHRRQLGEAGVALVVERTVGAHERRGRELVEHDDDDRASERRHDDVADVAGRSTGDQLRRRAEEEERTEEEQVGRRRGTTRTAACRACGARARPRRRRPAAPTPPRGRSGRAPTCAAAASPNAVAKAVTTTANTIVPSLAVDQRWRAPWRRCRRAAGPARSAARTTRSGPGCSCRRRRTPGSVRTGRATAG